MKNEINRALAAKKNEKEPDWKTVVVEIILKILSLGFYHIEKHKKS